MRLTWLIVCFIGGTSEFQLPKLRIPHLFEFIPRRICDGFPFLTYCRQRNLRPPQLVDVWRPYIEITVSPLATEESIRVLDISWTVGNQWRPGDWVGLYSRPPMNKTEYSLYSEAATTNQGWLRTGIQEERNFPVVAYFSKRCLGYWAAYWGAFQNEPVAITCLMTNPTWMEDNWVDIKDLSLNEIFLPGSHDAGSYTLNYKPFTPWIYNKFIYNQDESVLEQLIHGSRYLDLRIAHFPTTGFWINHQIIRTHNLRFVLEDIRLFLENTQEILVIDLHGFPIGFRGNVEMHEEFLEYLEKNLGQHIADYTGYGTTLGEIQNSGRRLIIAHNKPQIACQHPEVFWHSIRQKWGNVDNIVDLKNFLLKEMDRPHGNGMWAAMAELTPGTINMVTGRLGGLRDMMDTCNHNVTEWFRDDWGIAANVVAVDFLRSTGIVSAAIRWNREKGRKKRNEPNPRQTPGHRRPRTVTLKEYRSCIKELTRGQRKQTPWWDLGRNLPTPTDQSPIIFLSRINS